MMMFIWNYWHVQIEVYQHNGNYYQNDRGDIK